MGWQLWGRPVLLIPLAAEDPLTLLQFFRLRGDSTNELLVSLRVCELHLIELEAAGDEVHVGVVEARQQQLAAGIDDAGSRAAPGIHLYRCAYRDNSLVQNVNSFVFGMVAVNRPHIRVAYDCVRRRILLRSP